MTGKKDGYPLPRSEHVRIPPVEHSSRRRSIQVPTERLPEVFGYISPRDMALVLAAATGDGDLDAARRVIAEAAERWDEAQ
jgi:hypothetical protein